MKEGRVRVAEAGRAAIEQRHRGTGGRRCMAGEYTAVCESRECGGALLELQRRSAKWMVDRLAQAAMSDETHTVGR